MDKISRKEAIQAIIEIFNIENSEISKCVVNGENATFLIYKGEYERFEVVEQLRNYFSNKVLTDGQCRISPMTLVHTLVFIEDKEPEHE